MNKPRHGFTLVELSVTTAIVAILVAISIPAVTDSSRRGAVSDAANLIVSQLRAAQSQAILAATSLPGERAYIVKIRTVVDPVRQAHGWVLERLVDYDFSPPHGSADPTPPRLSRVYTLPKTVDLYPEGGSSDMEFTFPSEPDISGRGGIGSLLGGSATRLVVRSASDPAVKIIIELLAGAQRITVDRSHMAPL